LWDGRGDASSELRIWRALDRDVRDATIATDRHVNVDLALRRRRVTARGQARLHVGDRGRDHPAIERVRQAAGRRCAVRLGGTSLTRQRRFALAPERGCFGHFA